MCPSICRIVRLARSYHKACMPQNRTLTCFRELKKRHVPSYLRRCFAATVIVVALAAIPYLAHAGAAHEYFMVSVQVISRCELTLPGTHLPARRLMLSCTRGSGYQVLLDGRPLEAGAGSGRSKVLQWVGNEPRNDGLGRVQWLTILY